jgi:hypothetical protein
MSFITRKAFKKRDKKHVIEQFRRRLMTTKWIIKEKINLDGTIKYKARCVSRGFMQLPRVDYPFMVPGYGPYIAPVIPKVMRNNVLEACYMFNEVLMSKYSTV